MLFSLPRKRGINIAKIRGNKVTDYRNDRGVLFDAVFRATMKGLCCVKS